MSAFNRPVSVAVGGVVGAAVAVPAASAMAVVARAAAVVARLNIFITNPHLIR